MLIAAGRAATKAWLPFAVAAIGALALLATLPSSGEANNRHRDNFGNIIGWAHWGDGAGNGPGFVTLVDHTGSQWPVQAAANEWDFAGRLNVIYRFGSCGGSGHCADVISEQFARPCTERAGQAILVRQQNGNHIGGQSRIRLNTRCNSRPNREQRVITCHEEGNLFGLADEGQALEGATCMGAIAGRLGQASHTPRHHDFVMLDDRLYDHAD